MTLDELITCYHECGPVVAKLSLVPGVGYDFVEVCEKEPKLLKLFSLTPEHWLHYLHFYPNYAHLCDFQDFKLIHWLKLASKNIQFLTHVNLRDFPASDFDSHDVQFHMRRLVECYSNVAYAVPLEYLKRGDAIILLKNYPEMAEHIPQAMLDEIDEELQKYRLAKEWPTLNKLREQS